MDKTGNDELRTAACWALTAVYLLGSGWWARDHWTTIWSLNPESLGNWLAGVFSPLAFLWLVYTALAQRDELRLQRHELNQNNLTQKQQQSEMQRQANALHLQARRLEAQANAAYSPVLALHTFGSSPRNETRTWMQIENLGAQIIDIRRGENVAELVNIEYGNGTSRHIPGGMVAPNLPPQARLGLDIQDLHAPFALTVTRLDLAMVTFTLRLLPSEQRIEILEIVEAAEQDRARNQ